MLNLNHFQNWCQWFGSQKGRCDDKILQRVTFLLWSIWKSRNAVIFQNEIFNLVKCLIKAKRCSVEWRNRTCMSVDDLFKGTSSTSPHHNLFIRWQTPNIGIIKLNFDGSLQNNSRAGGFILRDWKGATLLTGAANYGSTSILVAEGRALRDGLQAAVEAGYKQLHIEGDNLILIEAVKGESTIPWRLKYVIHDIRMMLSQLDDVQVNHIYREANMAGLASQIWPFNNRS